MKNSAQYPTFWFMNTFIYRIIVEQNDVCRSQSGIFTGIINSIGLPVIIGIYTGEYLQINPDGEGFMGQGDSGGGGGGWGCSDVTT